MRVQGRGKGQEGCVGKGAGLCTRSLRDPQSNPRFENLPAPAHMISSFPLTQLLHRGHHQVPLNKHANPSSRKQVGYVQDHFHFIGIDGKDRFASIPPLLRGSGLTFAALVTFSGTFRSLHMTSTLDDPTTESKRPFLQVKHLHRVRMGRMGPYQSVPQRCNAATPDVAMAGAWPS